MDIIGKTKLNSPTSASKIQNPLANGKKVSKMKEMHKRNLRRAGVEEPRSPLK